MEVIIIGYESGNNWLARNKFAEIEFIPEIRRQKERGVSTSTGQLTDKSQQIPGSIFETQLDLTHPLCFGYTRDILPVFKSTSTAVKKDLNIYNNPIQYTEDPYSAVTALKGTLTGLKAHHLPVYMSNRVISIYDNTNFRAIWYGTNKVFLNAIFFGQMIR